MRFVTASIVTGLFLCTYLNAQTNRAVTTSVISTEWLQDILNMPNDSFASATDLAAYIKTHTSNDIERINFIFYRLINTIEYDTLKKSILETSNQEQNIETVFKEKKAVCADYAALFNFLCQKCGIAARIVDGWANTFETSGLSLHAWNLVRINNFWYPVDVTWAASDIKNSKLNGAKTNNSMSVSPEFFLNLSLKFRRTHFPFDPVFQLSTSLMNKLDFMNYDEDTNTFIERGVCDYLKILNKEINLSPDDQTLRSYERAIAFLPEERVIVQNFRFYGVKFIKQSFEETEATYKKLSEANAEQLSSIFTGDRKLFIEEIKKTKTAYENILLVADKIEYYDNAEKQQLLEENKNIIQERLTAVNEVLVSLERLQAVYFPELVVKHK